MDNNELLVQIASMMDEKLDAQFEKVDARFDQIDARFEKVDARFDQMDTRLDQMDTRLDQMDTRFDQMDTRLDQMDTRLDQMDARFDQMDKNFTQLKLDVAEMIEQSETRINIKIENDVEKRIDALVDGYQLNHEKQWELEKRVENIERRLDMAV